MQNFSILTILFTIWLPFQFLGTFSPGMLQTDWSTEGRKKKIIKLSLLQQLLQFDPSSQFLLLLVWCRCLLPCTQMTAATLAFLLIYSHCQINLPEHHLGHSAMEKKPCRHEFTKLVCTCLYFVTSPFLPFIPKKGRPLLPFKKSSSIWVFDLCSPSRPSSSRWLWSTDHALLFCIFNALLLTVIFPTTL